MKIKNFKCLKINQQKADLVNGEVQKAGTHPYPL